MQPHYCLFGAAPDTGNLGVSALCHASVASLIQSKPNAKVTVFDYGRGVRNATTYLENGEATFSLCGGFDTRRYYRRESLLNIRLSARFGGIKNPGARAMLTADAILDISGGDSFTDLYGSGRFWAVAMPKLMALEMGRPLVLLPQTYGPFHSAKFERIAERIVRGATLAWARDERSFELMKKLVGNSFDPVRHKSGVDVAFGLVTKRPPNRVQGPIGTWLETRDKPLVGFNISGLIYNDPNAGIQYGFQADYKRTVEESIRTLLLKTEARIILVPHVLTPPGHYESDVEACEAVRVNMGEAGFDRVAVLPAEYDQSQIKWVIAQTDWFCGTRMHSTIAALSSGVPTAAIAYSLKTLGVFEACGQGQHVADPRYVNTEEMIGKLWQSWTSRAEAKASLMSHLPRVKMCARDQMQEILGIPKIVSHSYSSTVKS